MRKRQKKKNIKKKMRGIPGIRDEFYLVDPNFLDVLTMASSVGRGKFTREERVTENE
jgi:hypothetical protein